MPCQAAEQLIQVVVVVALPLGCIRYAARVVRRLICTNNLSDAKCCSVSKNFCIRSATMQHSISKWRAQAYLQSGRVTFGIIAFFCKATSSCSALPGAFLFGMEAVLMS